MYNVLGNLYYFSGFTLRTLDHVTSDGSLKILTNRVDVIVQSEKREPSKSVPVKLRF